MEKLKAKVRKGEQSKEKEGSLETSLYPQKCGYEIYDVYFIFIKE